jgi:histidine triad (HIT) family protein
MSCLFCKIISEEIPSTKIFEDEYVIAFRDIQPQAPTHCLIIPRKHISTINDLSAEDTPLIGHMVQTAKKLAAEENLAENGYRLVMNVNDHGGQTVHHIHLHLLGGRRMTWPPG